MNPNPIVEINSAERQLGTLFPRSLIEFLSTYGDLSIKIELLNVAVELGVNLRIPAEFLGSTQIVRHTEGWVRGGMSSDLIAFATSATGDMFCIRRIEWPAEIRPDDAPIWHFDHEYIETEQVAESFVDWLNEFINIGKNP